MKRNLQKAIDEYKHLYHGRKDRKGAFYDTDYFQIAELSNYGKTPDDYIDTVFNALKAGFMVGYQAALRERRKASGKR